MAHGVVMSQATLQSCTSTYLCTGRPNNNLFVIVFYYFCQFVGLYWFRPRGLVVLLTVTYYNTHVYTAKFQYDLRRLRYGISEPCIVRDLCQTQHATSQACMNIPFRFQSQYKTSVTINTTQTMHCTVVTIFVTFFNNNRKQVDN